MTDEQLQDFRFRDTTRAPFRTEVKVRFDRFGGDVTAHTADISMEGMFLQSDDPRPVGTLVQFELALGDGHQEMVQGLGDVVWIRSDSQAAERPTGMGIQFRYVDSTSRERIRRIVAEFIDREGGAATAEAAPGSPPAVGGAADVSPGPPASLDELGTGSVPADAPLPIESEWGAPSVEPSPDTEPVASVGGSPEEPPQEAHERFDVTEERTVVFDALGGLETTGPEAAPLGRSGAEGEPIVDPVPTAGAGDSLPDTEPPAPQAETSEAAIAGEAVGPEEDASLDVEEEVEPPAAAVEAPGGPLELEDSNLEERSEAERPRLEIESAGAIASAEIGGGATEVLEVVASDEPVEADPHSGGPAGGETLSSVDDALAPSEAGGAGRRPADPFGSMAGAPGRRAARTSPAADCRSAGSAGRPRVLVQGPRRRSHRRAAVDDHAGGVRGDEPTRRARARVASGRRGCGSRGGDRCRGGSGASAAGRHRA